MLYFSVALVWLVRFIGWNNKPISSSTSIVPLFCSILRYLRLCTSHPISLLKLILKMSNIIILLDVYNCVSATCLKHYRFLLAATLLFALDLCATALRSFVLSFALLLHLYVAIIQKFVEKYKSMVERTRTWKVHCTESESEWREREKIHTPNDMEYIFHPTLQMVDSWINKKVATGSFV